MKLEKTTTGLIIREPTDEVKRLCLRYFSLSKPTREFFIYSGNDVDNKGVFGGERDVIYITSGFLKLNDNLVRNIAKHVSEIKPNTGKSIDLKMTREPRSPLQIDCIKKLTTSPSEKITVELKPGTGKMEPYSRKIPTPTPSGYTLMGDLKVGDFVFDRLGNKTKVTEIFEKGEQQVYDVIFDDGRIARCGLDHLWQVKQQDTSWDVMRLRDIINSFDKNNLYQIPVCSPVKYDTVDVSINGWIIGAILAYGDFNYGTLGIKTDDINIINKLCGLLDITAEQTGNPITSYVFKKDGLYLTFEDILGDYTVDVVDKHCIPHDYLINDIGVREDVLSGILAVSDSKFYNFIDDFDKLVYSLGYTLSKNCNGFTDDASNPKIINVIPSGVEKCRCIMVDNSEHLYLTEDYIVTHNTFISLYSIAKVGLKPLIVTPSTLLKNQWIENLTDSEIPMSNIASDIYDSVNKDFCVVTISSLENAMRDDWHRLMETLNKANFGIRITDESHLHLKGLLKLDSICNIKHNWYLSATLGRSDMAEDSILNRALADADRFIGNSLYKEYQREYVNIYLQDIHYYPTAKLCEQTFKFGTKGLVRSTYYNMLMKYKDGQPFLNNIIHMIKVAKSIIPVGKVLILVPMISIIEAALEKIKRDPYFSKFSCVGVDGSMNISKKREALESDIILSTSASMGVGVDISDLGSVVNFDQYASAIIVEQIVGRLRDRGKETYYFDICDNVRYAKTIKSWGSRRRSVMPFFPGVHSEFKKLKDLHC